LERTLHSDVGASGGGVCFWLDWMSAAASSSPKDVLSASDSSGELMASSAGRGDLS